MPLLHCVENESFGAICVFWKKSHDGSQSVPFIGPFRVRDGILNFCIYVNEAYVDSPMDGSVCVGAQEFSYAGIFDNCIGAVAHELSISFTQPTFSHASACTPISTCTHYIVSCIRNWVISISISIFPSHSQFGCGGWSEATLEKRAKMFEWIYFFSSAPFYKTLVNGKVMCSRCSSECKMK